MLESIVARLMGMPMLPWILLLGLLVGIQVICEGGIYGFARRLISRISGSSGVVEAEDRLKRIEAMLEDMKNEEK